MVHLGHRHLLEVSIVVVATIFNLKVFVGVVDVPHLYAVKPQVDVLGVL